jgi:hypothetical protein
MDDSDGEHDQEDDDDLRTRETSFGSNQNVAKVAAIIRVIQEAFRKSPVPGTMQNLLGRFAESCSSNYLVMNSE